MLLYVLSFEHEHVITDSSRSFLKHKTGGAPAKGFSKWQFQVFLSFIVCLKFERRYIPYLETMVTATLKVLVLADVISRMYQIV